MGILDQLRQEEPGEFSMLSTGNTSYRKSKPNRTFNNSKRSSTPKTTQKSSYSLGSSSTYNDYKKQYGNQTTGTPMNMTADMAIGIAESTLRGEWNDYVNRTRPTQQYLKDRIENLDLTKDTRKDVAKTYEISKGTTKRNLERYGQNLTAAEEEELERGFQRGEASALAGNLTTGRIQEQDLKRQLQMQLYGIENEEYLQGLAAVTAGGAEGYQRKAEYDNARTAWKTGVYNNIFGMLGNLS